MRSFHNYFPEWIQLLGIRIWVEIRNTIEFVQVVGRYYSNREFLKLDFALWRAYFFRNPYKISKKFLKAQGAKELHVYGETPLTSMEYIVKQCKITEKDTVIELGCGRGRACFWLHSFIHCKVIGIEYIPVFMRIANRIKTRYHLENIDFLCEDFLKSKLSAATILYLYGSTYEDEFIEQLVQKIEKLPKGVKIISVSYPLSDYIALKSFKLISVFPVSFTWGEADVYYQERI